jgi:hypothetical protein
MHLFFNHISKAALSIFAVALAWICFFRLNSFIFSYLEETPFINWIFIPSGIRLVSVLLLDELAVAGLFIGAIVTSPVFSINMTETLVISLISALNPYIAVHITKHLLKIDHILFQLRAKDLMLMAIFSAAFNALSHHLYFHLVALKVSWANCVKMFVGDLVGIALTLILFNIALKLIRRSTLANA